jgi:uncharacterized membrane protein
MKRLSYLTCAGGIASLVAVMVGWSIVAGLIYIPVIAIPLGIVAIYTCRKMVIHIIDDEREQRIRGDAAIRTLEVLFFTGLIVLAILLSYTISSSLAPHIAEHIITNEDKTRSMAITLHYSSPSEFANSSVRSFLIKNMEAISYEEAESYASFWQEGLRIYYDNAVSVRIIGYSLILLIVAFGIFYLYYRRKY